MTTSQANNPIGPGYEGVAGSEKRFRDIFRDTLRAEMLRDEDVFLMGEDISGGFDKDTKEPLDAWGGPFAATKGLVQEFGVERIRDAPISEAGFVGAAVGSALTGMRPVVDLMYFDFVTVAFDQLLSNAAKSRYMFGGQTKVPLTLFARSGAGTGHAALREFLLDAGAHSWSQGSGSFRSLFGKGIARCCNS